MTIKRPSIKLSNLQIKSPDAFKHICAGINEIEEYGGIHETTIEFDGCFVCPWMKIIPTTPMEELVEGLITKMKVGKQ